MVKPVPDGYHTLTPQLVVRDSARAIEFYKQAFGAEEIFRMASPDGKRIMHAEVRIGDSIVFLNDEAAGGNCRAPETTGHATGSLFVYVPDVDAAFERAVKAGAQVVMPVADMFWGDRFGALADPFGHQWSLATHVEDVTPEQMPERAKAFFAKMGAAG